MGTCCSDVSSRNEGDLEVQHILTHSGSKGKGFTHKKSLRDLVAYGDARALGLVIRIQFRMRSLLIKKGIIKDLKHRDENRKYYFQDSDYYETIEPKNKINLSKTNELETRVYDYKKTQATYSGTWLGGFRHGQGTMVFKDGTSFTGQWQFGVAHGSGRFEMANGIKYEGMFSLGRAYGMGKLIDGDGNFYIGEFKMDKKHGFGKQKDAEGNYFKGDFVNGAKTGFGTKKWKNGATYEGEWQDNHINGFGFYYWPKDHKNYKGYYAHD